MDAEALRLPAITDGLLSSAQAQQAPIAHHRPIGDEQRAAAGVDDQCLANSVRASRVITMSAPDPGVLRRPVGSRLLRPCSYRSSVAYSCRQCGEIHTARRRRDKAGQRQRRQSVGIRYVLAVPIDKNLKLLYVNARMTMAPSRRNNQCGRLSAPDATGAAAVS